MILVDGPALARRLGVDPSVIRKWSHRGYLHRADTDARGRALFDLADAFAAERAVRQRREAQSR